MSRTKTVEERHYLYNVGDVVNGLLITEQCLKQDKTGLYKKAYKYKCLTCGYDCGGYYKNGEYYDELKILEGNLKRGAGCAACKSSGIIIPSINSIHVLAPEVEEFLINKDDAFKYAPNSNAKVECRCLDCGREYLRSCAKITHYGVPCICGDGFSYPEKFTFNVLQQLNVDFEPQYYLNGSTFRYDFYLKDYNTIIEVNGIQHYKKKWDYRDEPENDIKKKEFAFSCGFTEDNYIVIDCRESSMDFIKLSLLNSKLNNIFDFNTVDFIKSSQFATSNLVKTACELWNNGETIQSISDVMYLDKHTIIRYLKQGNDNGWCLYNVGDGVKRRPNLATNLKQKTKPVLSAEENENKKIRKRIYNSWSNMKNKCCNVKNKKYNRCGGNGIEVCNEWSDFETFLSWALNNGYKDNLVLKRIDVSKNYCPENCCWVSKDELYNNKSTNHFLTLNGETHTIQEWSRITGIDRRTISKRINRDGWSVADALTKPIKKRKSREELLISFNGEEHTLSEWSKILNIKRETLKSRLHNGWSIEKAFTSNVKYKNNINK